MKLFDWWDLLYCFTKRKGFSLWHTCSSLVLSCCWALCRSFSTLWSFSEVSWRIFSCDTVTVFLTFIFPTKVRTSPCSFLMIPLACIYIKEKKDRSKTGVDHFQQNSQLLLFFPYNRDAVRSLSFQSNQYQYKRHPIKQDVVHCVGHSCILLIYTTVVVPICMGRKVLKLWKHGPV